MKNNGLGIILLLGIVALTFFVFGMIAQMHFLHPYTEQKARYQPTAMKCVEYDQNDMIIHGPVKISFLDPNEFK